MPRQQQSNSLPKLSTELWHICYQYICTSTVDTIAWRAAIAGTQDAILFDTWAAGRLLLLTCISASMLKVLLPDADICPTDKEFLIQRRPILLHLDRVSFGQIDIFDRAMLGISYSYANCTIVDKLELSCLSRFWWLCFPGGNIDVTPAGNIPDWESIKLGFDLLKPNYNYILFENERNDTNGAIGNSKSFSPDEILKLLSGIVNEQHWHTQNRTYWLKLAVQFCKFVKGWCERLETRYYSSDRIQPLGTSDNKSWMPKLALDISPHQHDLEQKVEQELARTRKKREAGGPPSELRRSKRLKGR